MTDELPDAPKRNTLMQDAVGFNWRRQLGAAQAKYDNRVPHACPQFYGYELALAAAALEIAALETALQNERAMRTATELS